MRERLKDIFGLIHEKLDHPLQIRLAVVGLFFVLLFGVLANKLYNLQVVSGDSYSDEFIEKTERSVKIPGARGNIYDADGNLLAYNRLAYNVVIADNGAYKSYNDRNLMLYRLASILEKHNVNVVTRFEVDVEEDGSFRFTTGSESARRRFVANVYGVPTSQLDQPDEDGVVRYPSAMTAEEAFRKKVSDYAFDAIKDADGAPVLPDDRTLLDMVKILYAMRQTAFQRYETSTIAEDIDENCMAELLENQGELRGMNVEETYIRRYNNARYFSHIIGYTGAIQDETKLRELQKSNPDYMITDSVGATGIEKTMEQHLQGTKGQRDMHVDNYGQILEIINETAPSAGNDFYLTIQQNLQIGVYHLLEQQLAGIIANKIVNMAAADIELPEESSEIVISVDEAYFQFINNNILDTAHFFNMEERGAAEAEIAEGFRRHKDAVMERLRYELTSGKDVPLAELSNEYVSYMAYIYEYLSQSSTGIIDKNGIDIYGESYLSWKNDTISLRNYIYAGISEGWVNIDHLNLQDGEQYQDSDYIYDRISELILKDLENDSSFDKLIYRYMLLDRDGLSGRLLCMALYEQGVLKNNPELYYELSVNGEDYAYSFLIDRIKDIDITPAQLALDPCMGSVVITDVNTGDVKALVAYPGYDNNRINDRSYFNACLHDQSLPLINSATQTNKAPGSTFKPLAAAAVLEEKVVGPYEQIYCSGVYEEVEPNIKCWIGRPGHAALTVAGAIENSCNYSFAEYGHRLATTRDPETGEETYSTTLGIERLQKYISMFGLDRVSGIQIDEKEPHMTDSDPERSAFGQGTNSYNNVQLARYTTALATGKLFNLTLLQKETDPDGNLIQYFPAEQIDTVQLMDTTWNIVRSGVRSVITTGVARRVFQGYETVEIAGKTGTAEEVKTRGNHAEFISYAPYDNPEIAVTVVIPFGYSSGNAARLARRVYDYYYGATDLPSIINGNARDIEIINVVGG